MAVCFYEVGGDAFGPRNFHPPKRADLKYWYRECKKALGTALPDWHESFRHVASIDEETIIFDFTVGVLTIARKKNLR